MKIFAILLAFLTTNVYAQSNLQFEKLFIESEDRWVAFKPDKDSAYPFGFIYIDEIAGLTLQVEGNFTINKSGKYEPTKNEKASFKVRLQPNNVLVAFIPENKFQELNIQALPDWLKNYKSDTNAVSRLYRWGFLYNAYGSCAKALTYLERAQKIDPNYENLAVELAYSYNCLEEYQKAEDVLLPEIKKEVLDAYVNKEYIFTLTKNNKIEKAMQQFNKAVTTLTDNQYDAENCYNILQYFYFQNDKVNFNKWFDELKKHPNKNSQLSMYADNMKLDINK